MKYLKGIISALALPVLLLLSGACSKVEEPDNRELDYGYVQFKLYKEASYPAVKSTDGESSGLEYLSDAAKIKVKMKHEETTTITQTLVLNSSDANSAEYGLRSDKLKLLAGSYRILNFTLYGKLDTALVMVTPQEEHASFSVVSGGLNVHDLLVGAKGRGKVRFSLVKDMSSFENSPITRAAEREYTFDEIDNVTISVRDKDNNTFTFEKLPAEFSVHFKENDDLTDGYQTSSFICDTLLALPAGEYTVDSYKTYNSSKNLLETNARVSASFSVEDNGITEADVPVTLYESDDYIKDYYALYAIWKNLDGENWYYSGEDYTKGTNWDFNKDPDLWGDQPGVSLHSNGRVAMINLSDFGFSGKLPEDIKDLTALVELYLGNHNDQNLLDYDPTVVENSGSRDRFERHMDYLHRTHVMTQFSEPVARAMAEHDIIIPEVRMYDSLTEDEIIEKGTGRMRIQPKDVNAGKYCNGLTELPEAIGELKNLEKLYIANGKLSSLPESMANLTALTDLEIYNCPDMKEFPMVISKMPSLISVNLSNNPQWSSAESDEGLKALATGASKSKIQILYMNNCNLSKVDGDDIANMTSIGLLDLANNKITEVTPFGKNINIVQLYLDNNLITELKRGADGYFCGINDIETFSVTHNRITKFPDIFDAASKYYMASVDFSHNLITEFENGDNGSYKGMNVSTLSLTNNLIETYPKCLVESESKISYINMRGCKLNNIPEGSFVGKNSWYTTSIDFSYNRLTDLPEEFHAGNLPYLYSLDLSYNAFSSFPWEPLDSAYLTAFSVRGQRDENGRRCLSEWPTGIYQHKGLRGFYIGSNNLGKINDTISTLCYYLDISDNPEIVFDASDICSSWYYGYFYLIYDKDQDIRNCEYMLE